MPAVCQPSAARTTEGSQIILKKLKYANEAIKGRTQTLAPIVKGSCQPSIARMTEGLKAAKKLKWDKGKQPSDAAAYNCVKRIITHNLAKPITTHNTKAG